MTLRHTTPTMTIVAIVTVVIGLVVPVSPTAFATSLDAEHAFGEMVEYPMAFPLDGTPSYTDTFWAARSYPDPIHHATDLMTPKLTPVLAAADGTISSVNWSHNPDSIDPTRCCTIAIEHDDGWSSWYIHINNDTPGTDDGAGVNGPTVDGEPNPAWGIAPGILPGVHVYAGQLIGWSGDSGNAENTSPHLHFELMDTYGVKVDAFQSLKDAEAGLFDVCTPEDTVCRTFGSDRYATAAEISAAAFPDGADTVVIATGTQFPDALAGAAVAGRLGAPILLVAHEAIPSTTAAELSRLDPSHIVILGGEAAVSSGTATDLTAFGDVERISGPDRYATSAAISAFGFPDGADVAFVATGTSFADALAGGPTAAKIGGPILLVAPEALSQSVADELERLSPDAIVVFGGTSAVSDQVFQQLDAIAPTSRVFGANRYATAAAISTFAFSPPLDELYIAVGSNFPDALAAGAAAGVHGVPLLIVERDGLPAPIAAEIARLQPAHVTILGGSTVIDMAVQQAVALLLEP